MKTQLISSHNSNSESYSNEDGSIIFKREPEYKNYWVLRVNGKYIDHNQYRHDLAGRNNIKLISILPDTEY